MVLADVAIALIISPLTAWATVMFTQTAINELAAGSPFFEILKAIIVYELVITACILLQAGYHICYRDKREKRLQVLVNRSIYEQVLRTDYVYFDNAEFYDGYAMAVNELVAKSAEAANLLVSVVSSVSTLTAMAAHDTGRRPALGIDCRRRHRRGDNGRRKAKQAFDRQIS